MKYKIKHYSQFAAASCALALLALSQVALSLDYGDWGFFPQASSAATLDMNTNCFWHGNDRRGNEQFHNAKIEIDIFSGETFVFGRPHEENIEMAIIMTNDVIKNRSIPFVIRAARITLGPIGIPVSSEFRAPRGWSDGNCKLSREAFFQDATGISGFKALCRIRPTVFKVTGGC